MVKIHVTVSSVVTSVWLVCCLHILYGTPPVEGGWEGRVAYVEWKVNGYRVLVGGTACRA